MHLTSVRWSWLRHELNYTAVGRTLQPAADSCLENDREFRLSVPGVLGFAVGSRSWKMVSFGVPAR
jgi:hypothetical protein